MARRVLLVGQPNAGKSTLLNALTGASAVVSNFPGTTVEIFSARLKTGREELELVDTPGVYSLTPRSAEKAVTVAMLDEDPDAVVLNVVDGCNLLRHLALTKELLERGRTVVVAVNQVDRMRLLGISVDMETLSDAVGVPVVPVAALTGEGVARLKKVLVGMLGAGDGEVPRLPPLSALKGLVRMGRMRARLTWGERLEALLDGHLFGFALLVLGAIASCVAVIWFQSVTEWLLSGVLVKLEQLLVWAIEALPISGAWKDAAMGVIPGGLIVPFGIVMPSMLGVYIVMALLEDSGLLPRIVTLADGACNAVGFQGDCLIPAALAFGCRTPAILATRVIADHRQKAACQCLISVAIPCAATTGIVGAVIRKFSANGTVITVTGVLGAYAVAAAGSGSFPLRPAPLLLELPALRLPLISNVWRKTWGRMSHFFSQALPLLVITNIAVRLAITQGVLDGLGSLTPITGRLLGIRGEAAAGLLVTIVQRYLAPLVLLNLRLTPREATICAAMLLLSFPCVPVTACLLREAGARRALRVFCLSLLTMAGTGLILNAVLP